ncbi:hypothetical protein FOCC_FOCC012893 [Frankliniella occidentalis]|nr:hypothetical protein FOCC_FOCC012893 [Frankliniella occidentalis]
MPGTHCAIISCCINSESKPPGVILHCSPKADNWKRLWMLQCGREEGWNPKVFYICSEHFAESSYERDFRSELLNLPKKRKLLKDAIPTLNLVKVQNIKNERIQVELPFSFCDTNCDNCDLCQTNKISKSERNNYNNEFDLHARNVQFEIDDKDELIKNLERQLEIMKNEMKLKDCDVSRLKEDLNLSKKELDECFQKSLKEAQEHKKNNSMMEKKLEQANESIRALTRENNYLATSLKNMKIKSKTQQLTDNEITKLIHQYLPGVFTTNQIQILTGQRKYPHWTDEELTIAFTLRYMGKRAYKFVTKTLKIPLPSLSKLHRWASKLNIRPGSLQCIFKVMKAVAACFEEHEKIGIVTFDEVKVKEVHEYDPKHDCVQGPHSQMQVAMIRGLFAKWKVPIFLDFDRKMMPDLLRSLITDAHEAGYLVKGCCSDMGGGNQGLLRDSGISTAKSWMPHPLLENEKIYFFGDAPHCLKLVRNWLVDTGFFLPDGSIVNKDPLERLFNQVEVSSCFKLTSRHIKCEKTERQSVRLAAELISQSTSTALRRYFPNDESATKLASVIETINGWFDIFNSYILYDVPLKSAYGTNLEIQEKCLDEMTTLMSGMKCVGKTCLQIFQKAILLSISSLKLLRIEMESRFNKPFLLTHRLNQDVLENFFSQLRTRGGLHDHPTPPEALWRVRMVILGKNPGIVQANSNSLDRSKNDGGEFLTLSALQALEEESTENTDSNITEDLCGNGAVSVNNTQVISPEDDSEYLFDDPSVDEPALVANHPLLR